jgi:hypothetical protein
MADPGILAIFNNVTAGREAEFEDWFQLEHLPERLAVPGFLLGRRHEAIVGEPRYFNYYLTSSPDVLTSAAYRARVDHPTAMTRTVMSQVFRDMIRTVCRQVLRLGTMRGSVVVAARFAQAPSEAALTTALEKAMAERAVACGELWMAVEPSAQPVSEEERLRGGDRKIGACLLVETLRLPEAQAIAAALATRFTDANVGIYRLLCEIRLR